MSRAYQMQVRITGVDPRKEFEVKEAANEEWDFDDWTVRNGLYASTADGDLGGGESEDEFTDRLASAIMRANGQPCAVMVIAVCLDDLPHQIHERGPQHYDRYRETCPIPEEED